MTQYSVIIVLYCFDYKNYRRAREKRILASILGNFRFSPCIIIVNHFYCPINTIIQTNEVKIYVV